MNVLLSRFKGGQRFGIAGSKLAVFFNYLNEIKANIIIYNQKSHIFFRKKFEVIFIPAYWKIFGSKAEKVAWNA